MRITLLYASFLLLGQTAFGHDVITTNLTYTRDISRIFARHCVSCHGQNSSIPLTNYEDVRPWAVSIKNQVLRRFMPPWGAVKGFGDLAPDYGLSQEDITVIAAWVVGGAPKGNISLLPKSEPESSPKTEPDLTDKLVVRTTAELKKEFEAAGIRPLPEGRVDSARLIAKFPDGRIEPLLWLYQYDPKFPRSFHFRHSLMLPAGTVVESSAPLQFALECAAKDP